VPNGCWLDKHSEVKHPLSFAKQTELQFSEEIQIVMHLDTQQVCVGHSLSEKLGSLLKFLHVNYGDKRIVLNVKEIKDVHWWKIEK